MSVAVTAATGQQVMGAKGGAEAEALAWAGAPGGWCCCGRSHAAPPGAPSALACLGASALLLGYALLGGLLFLALETPAQHEAVAASQPLGGGAEGGLRARTVERLWAITEDLNILYKDNWTRLAATELMDFQRGLLRAATAKEGGPPVQHHRWTFATSCLYALTLITTIGWGGSEPSSGAGRAAAVAYASLGIPLVMLYLATVGGALARRFRRLYGRLWRERGAGGQEATPPDAGPRQTPFQAALNLSALGVGGRKRCVCAAHGHRVPVLVGVLPLLLYLVLGAALFAATEGWGLLEGGYFAFCSLATIGFGHLRPGAGGAPRVPEELALGACCGYILLGMAVVAMSFDLVRQELGTALQGRAARVCPPARHQALVPEVEAKALENS